MFHRPPRIKNADLFLMLHNRLRFAAAPQTVRFLPRKSLPSSSHSICTRFYSQKGAISERKLPTKSNALAGLSSHAGATRHYQHMAQSNEPNDKAKPKATSKVVDTTTVASSPGTPTPKDGVSTKDNAVAKTAVDLGGETVDKTNAEQRRADWRIIKNLAVNLWPKGWDEEARRTKTRVLVALALLIGGKVR